MELIEKVIKIIQENILWEGNINPDSELIKDLGIDSFGRLMIVNSIEDEFSIEVDEEDFIKLKTVSDIITVLEQKYLPKTK